MDRVKNKQGLLSGIIRRFNVVLGLVDSTFRWWGHCPLVTENLRFSEALYFFIILLNVFTIKLANNPLGQPLCAITDRWDITGYLTVAQGRGVAETEYVG